MHWFCILSVEVMALALVFVGLVCLQISVVMAMCSSILHYSGTGYTDMRVWLR